MLVSFLKPAGRVFMLMLACSLMWTQQEPLKSLPAGVLNAMHEDEAQRCKQVSGRFEKNCHHNFISHLRWRELRLTPLGKTGILVENTNQGFCGSAGCAVSLFIQEKHTSFIEVLDEIGTLGSVKVLKTITKGHYDLEKTWSDQKTRIVYRWEGSLYSHEQ
jgi:hypothetical protein